MRCQQYSRNIGAVGNLAVESLTREKSTRVQSQILEGFLGGPTTWVLWEIYVVSRLSNWSQDGPRPPMTTFAERIDENRSVKRTSAPRENSRLLGLVAAVVVIATLYFARVVFIPLALALLFSLVLTPPVGFLERIKLPRVLAIFLVVVVLVGLMGLIGWKSGHPIHRLHLSRP